MVTRCFLVLSLALALTPCTASADTRKQSACTGSSPGLPEIIHHPALYNFRLENDVFNSTDSGYTSGVNFSWVSANLQNYLSDPCLPHWVRQFNQLFESVHPRAGTSRNMAITAGQLMYTPQDRTRTDVITTDRPYAAWLYLGLGYNARSDRRMDAVEINLGVVGPAALGQPSQNFIHDLRGAPRFNGWDNQLKNELGVQIVAEREKRMWEYKKSTGPQYDAIVHYGVSLGNVRTYLNTGFALRIGSRIPNDFGTSPIRPGGEGGAPLEGHVTHRFAEGGLHAFISVDARLVARDIFLDGNTFVAGPHIEKRRFVDDLAGGIVWQWEGGKLAYAQHRRSKEFSAQSNSHGYGSITLSIEYGVGSGEWGVGSGEWGVNSPLESLLQSIL